MQNEKKGMSNFAVRTLTTVIGGGIMAALLVLGGIPLCIILGILAVIGYMELLNAMGVGINRTSPDNKPGEAGSSKYSTGSGINGLFLAGIFTIGWWYVWICAMDSGLGSGLCVLVIGFLLMMAMYVFYFPVYKAEDVTKTFFSVIYLPVLLSFVYLIRMMDNGVVYVWIVPICSWICDICAYLVGVKFGKHKMSPKLSPKKSIEGAIGGVAGSALVGGIYAYFLIAPRLEKPVWEAVVIFVIICVAGALISMIGDLAASAIKRDNDIKDYGHIIPGHGGVMDRFDSFIFVAPLVYMMCRIFL